MALKWRKLRSKLLEGLRKNRHLLMARQMFSYSSIWKTICILIVVVFLISIPWEFVNLYQKEVAKKTAIVIKGTPPECDPESMCWWKSLTVVLHSNFFWSHDPCEEYYKAVLAEPLWEVTPLKVLLSVFVRCFSLLEDLASIAGNSRDAFMRKIPTIWQPVFIVSCIISTTLVSAVGILAYFGYSLNIPFMFTLRQDQPHASDAAMRSKDRSVWKRIKSSCKSLALGN